MMCYLGPSCEKCADTAALCQSSRPDIPPRIGCTIPRVSSPRRTAPSRPRLSTMQGVRREWSSGANRV
eukprot:3934547-Rhodomonas_salina.3